jgi:starch phosphorylase
LHHLKSASDAGLPLVGVGLLYLHGYFQQYLNANGMPVRS